MRSHNRWLQVFFIGFLVLNGKAAFQPLNKATLHYNTIYFKEEFIENAGEYELLLAPDTLNASPELKTRKGIPAFLLKDLGWGRKYFWRINVYDKTNKLLSAGRWHQFSIVKITARYFEDQRLQVKTNSEKLNAGGLVCVDRLRTIYDRRGNARWTIPFIDSLVNQRSQVIDLRVSPKNSITFLTDAGALETSFAGELLWHLKTPCVVKSDTIRLVHQLQKTAAGNYMVLGNHRVYRKLPDGTVINEKNRAVVRLSGVPHLRYEAGIIMEFDKKGNLVWSWDGLSYINEAELSAAAATDRLTDQFGEISTFISDASGNKLYLGFPAHQRIVRIDKKTGRVENTYGQNNNTDLQHPARMAMTKNNNLLVFDNSGKDQNDVAEILELKTDPMPGDKNILWRFALNFDALSDGKSGKGGSVAELSNSSLLVCSGAGGRLFEVNRAGEISWDAFAEIRTGKDTSWKSSVLNICNFTEELPQYHVLPQLLNSGKPGTFSLVLHNTGDKADAYSVEVIADKKKTVYTSKTKSLPGNSKQALEIVLKDLPSGNKKIIARVKSLTTGQTEEITISQKG